MSRSWPYELLARYRAEGQAAFEPRSRRPWSSPRAIGNATVELIIRIQKELAERGLDAGPDTIAWHLVHHHATTVSPAMVGRYLSRAGLVTPAPRKRPKASYLRFQAELPNECWQSDLTHYRLVDGADVEILTFLDDHSRFALSATAHRRVTGPIVVATFRDTAARHGIPASTLTDMEVVDFVRSHSPSTTVIVGGPRGQSRPGCAWPLHARPLTRDVPSCRGLHLADPVVGDGLREWSNVRGRAARWGPGARDRAL